MREVKFVKYNKMRKEKFQLKTTIYTEDGVLLVEKAALGGKGHEHIQSFGEKYEKLNRVCSHIKALKPEIQDGKMKYPYVTGHTLSEVLSENIKQGAGLIDEIKQALHLVFDVEDEFLTDFIMTRGFKEVFGNAEGMVDKAVTIANVDALFDNILKTDEGYLCLDYEWVFEFPVPVRFLYYRNLSYFYIKYRSLISYESMEAFLLEFGITADMVTLYKEMELSFQEYVHGKDHQDAYMNRYTQKNVSFQELLEMENTVPKQLDRIIQLQDEVEEKNQHIRMMQETQRLTQNHVTNLEGVISTLRADISNKEEELNYLRNHEGLSSKAKRGLKLKVNQSFPKGSKRRKILGYAKRTLTSPVKTIGMYVSEDGRNRIAGDFNIGSGYLDRGRLVFPQVEHPKVSIIIPVYNQIHYTYSCLVSILEHTKDVSYEIIIADDVSTDATAELGKYANNIKISRNQINQGFLKNCNHAAEQATGEYVLFLNNDTQVRPEWLKTLVDLIESDETIGMVGSKLIYPDGRLQEAGGILWSDGSGWNYGRLDDPNKAEYNYVREVDYISGASMMLSTGLWKEIGGFDERFAPAYCEDSDLAFEVRKRGYRVMYQPLSVVVHYEGISNGTDVNGTGMKKYQIENSKKLKEKWADEFSRQCYNDGNPNPFLARERGVGKPVILFVDHYVPTFDKDAGSKTTYQYLKMFLKMGYLVKFVGDNYLHEEPYTTALQQMGVEVLYGADYQAGIWDWIKRNQDYITVAYLNRPHIATKYIDFIKDHTDIKIIYYGHDLHFLRETREYQLTGDPKKKRDADYWKTMETSLMYRADMSYYPSYVEEEAIHAIDQTIRVKAITAYVYEEFLSDIPADFAKRKGLLFVGGFAHPPNADAVLWFAKEVYPKIREQIEIPFYIVGSKVTEEIKKLEGNGIIVKGFVSEEELEELYRTTRLTVVPLRYGAGVKGKVVEALYYGSPIVTTSVGAEGIPKAGEVMVIRDLPEEFADEVVNLYQDEERLKAACHKSQDYVKENYSLEAAWDVIKEDFTEK